MNKKSIQEIEKHLHEEISNLCRAACCNNIADIDWSTNRSNLPDGDYVGILPQGGKVFVSVQNGELYPKEYCKHLVAWLHLPKFNMEK